MPEQPAPGAKPGVTPPNAAPQGSQSPPDRLIVRREAVRELEFRYDRAERLARRTAPARSAAGGSLLKNRASRVLLLNVALLAVVAVAASRLLLAPGDRARIGPYQASLQCLPAGEAVYVSVTVRYAGRAEAEGPAARFTALLALDPDGEPVLKTAALPRSPGEEVTVGEALMKQGAARVRADLQLGERKRTLLRELAR